MRVPVMVKFDRAQRAGDFDIGQEETGGRLPGFQHRLQARGGVPAECRRESLRAVALSKCSGRMSVAPSQRMVPEAISQSKAATAGGLGRQKQTQLIFQRPELGEVVSFLQCGVQHNHHPQDRFFQAFRGQVWRVRA